MRGSVKTAFTFQPIGEVRTPYARGWAPEQPVEREPEEGKFRVIVRPRYAAGLALLSRFRYVYLLTALDRVQGRPKMVVSPAWAGGKEAGIFATREPGHPNPIGLHVVRVRRIEGNVIETWPIDAYDRTPLLDIKPYIRDLDSKEDADYGWLADVGEARHLVEHLRGVPHHHDHGPAGHAHLHEEHEAPRSRSRTRSKPGSRSR